MDVLMTGVVVLICVGFVLAIVQETMVYRARKRKLAKRHIENI